MRLPQGWELPEKITQRFGQKGAGRQRAMAVDEHLLLVLHSLPDPKTDERETIFFWRKPTGEWLFSGRGDGMSSLRKHVQTYEDASQKMSGAYKKAVSAQDYFSILDDLAPLYHAARNLHATLQDGREATPNDRDLIDLRDAAYEIERDLDLLHTDTKNALDFTMAKQAEEQARIGRQELKSARRLNVLAAIFFPLTAIAGIFGMNLPHGFEQAPIWGFWGVFLFGILLGILTCKWVMK